MVVWEENQEQWYQQASNYQSVPYSNEYGENSGLSEVIFPKNSTVLSTQYESFLVGPNNPSRQDDGFWIFKTKKETYDKIVHTIRKWKLRHNTKTQPKPSITQRMRADSGRSVREVYVIQLVCFNPCMGSQHTYLPQKLCN